MAKEKNANIRKAALLLQRVEYTPKDDNGNPVVYKSGEPVVKILYQINLNVLGKLHQFRVLTKGGNDEESVTESKLLDEFFRLKESNELPVKVERNEFKTADGKTVETFNVLCQLDEKDNIHVVRLYPVSSDKKLWNMAIQEIALGYKLPESYANVRKKNYEAAQKAKKEKKVVQDISEDGGKDEELPF